MAGREREGGEKRDEVEGGREGGGRESDRQRMKKKERTEEVMLMK